jgi:hypothetical protein
MSMNSELCLGCVRERSSDGPKATLLKLGSALNDTFKAKKALKCRGCKAHLLYCIKHIKSNPGAHLRTATTCCENRLVVAETFICNKCAHQCDHCKGEGDHKQCIGCNALMCSKCANWNNIRLYGSKHGEKVLCKACTNPSAKMKVVSYIDKVSSLFDPVTLPVPPRVEDGNSQ